MYTLIICIFYFYQVNMVNVTQISFGCGSCMLHFKLWQVNVITTSETRLINAISKLSMSNKTQCGPSLSDIALLFVSCKKGLDTCTYIHIYYVCYTRAYVNHTNMPHGKQLHIIIQMSISKQVWPYSVKKTLLQQWSMYTELARIVQHNIHNIKVLHVHYKII